MVYGEPFVLSKEEGVPGKVALSRAAEQVRVRLAAHVDGAIEITGERLPGDTGMDT